MNRNEARKIVMIILYQAFIHDKNNIDYDINELINENLNVDNDFVKDMVHGVMDNKKNLEKKADDNLNGWSLSRLGLTDQAILLLGLYELLYTDTPEVVAINEAVELAKKYSDDAVKNMINAVLDKVYHEKIA